MTTDATFLEGAPVQDFRDEITSILSAPGGDWKASFAKVERLASVARSRSAEAVAEADEAGRVMAEAKAKTSEGRREACRTFGRRAGLWLVLGLPAVIAAMAVHVPVWALATVAAPFFNGLLWSFARFSANLLRVYGIKVDPFEPRSSSRLAHVVAYLEFPVRFGLALAFCVIVAVLALPVILFGFRFVVALCAMALMMVLALGSLYVVAGYESSQSEASPAASSP